MYSITSSDESATRLAYDAQRQVYVYGNAEGEVVNASVPSERVTTSDAGITCMAVNPTGDKCAIALDSEVQERLFPASGDSLPESRTREAPRKELCVSHMEYDHDGTHLFVSSLSAGIEVISLTDGVSGTANVQTGETGVRTFALAADTSAIGVVDLKGNVNVSSLQAVAHPIGKIYPTNTVEHSVSGVVSGEVAMMTGEDVEGGCKVSFASIAGKHVLAVPSKHGSVVLVCEKSDYWNDMNLLPEDPEGDLSHGEADLSLCAFSPTGTHLATADVLGNVLVWQVDAADLKQSKPVKKFAGAGTKLFDLAWGRAGGDTHLLASSRNGACRLEEAAVAAPVLVPDQTESQPVEAVAAAPEAAVAPVGAKKRLLKKHSAVEDSDEETEFDGPSGGTAVSTATSAAATLTTANSEEPVEPVDMESIDAIKLSTKRISDEGDDDDQMDDNGDILAEWGNSALAPGLTDLDARLANLETTKTDALVPIQPPFQPGSTINDDKYRRYLVWNSIGSITLREEREQQQNRIEIRFADVNGRNKQEAFADTDGFVMAALSHEGAIFATPMEEADEDDIQKPKGSKIHYHAFAAQPKLVGANDTFTLDLPEGEEATNVAVGTGWCAVATNMGYLRVFSSTGVQTNVMWLKGPTVTLCGTSTQLAVFYNAGQPVGGTVQVKLELYSLFWDRPASNRCICTDLCVPLSAKGQLRWAGFETETRSVAICDTAGIVSMLLKPMGWQWVPVLDVERAKRDPSHVWWPIQVRKDKLGYVLLNGESKPAIYPPPVVATRLLRVPVAEVREGRDKGEAANQRAHDLVFAQAVTAHYEALKVEEDVFAYWAVEDDMSAEALETRYEKQQIEADKTVLKMFQDACRTHQAAKALDLAHKLRTEKALQAGTQIANKFGKPAVAAKVDELLEARFAQQQQLRQLKQEQEQQQQQQTYYHPEEPAPAQHTPAAARTVEPQHGGGYGSGGEEARPVEIYEDEPLGPASAVTPAEEARASKPSNPFKKAAHSPVKRKAGEYDYDELKKMKASPSPAKKPLLSRQSSFTENARSQRLNSNSFL